MNASTLLVFFVAVCHGKFVVKNNDGVDMIEVQFQPNGVKVFDDSGSGADQDLSVWSPAELAGFRRVGHCAQANKGGNGMECTAAMVKDISGLSPIDPLRPIAVALAVSGPIWTDKGSGADTDFGFWSLVCPDGFVALSDLGAVGYSIPGQLQNDVACVNVLYLNRCSLASSPIWTDKGSGADQDGSVWAQTGGNNPQYNEHFRASGSNSQPSTQPWCLKQMVEVED